MYGFTYTSQGAMTAADMDEIRRDMDLDLCTCCERDGYEEHVRRDQYGVCRDCGHMH
jgi:hypothetical protein